MLKACFPLNILWMEPSQVKYSSACFVYITSGADIRKLRRFGEREVNNESGRLAIRSKEGVSGKSPSALHGSFARLLADLRVEVGRWWQMTEFDLNTKLP